MGVPIGRSPTHSVLCMISGIARAMLCISAACLHVCPFLTLARSGIELSSRQNLSLPGTPIVLI